VPARASVIGRGGRQACCATARRLVGTVSKQRGRPSTANHLALIRRFLIDSGAHAPRRERLCAKIFCNAYRFVAISVNGKRARPSMILRHRFRFAVQRDCCKKCRFHRCFFNIGKMRANYRECVAPFVACPAPASGLRFNGLRTSDMYTLR